MIGIFALVLGTYYAVASTDFYEEQIFEPYLTANAAISQLMLTVIGEESTVSGAVISSPNFSVVIARGCDGIEAMALFVAALFAFPATWRLRLPALLVCIPILAFVNVVRIVSLCLISAYYPDLFYVAHTDVWQALYIGFGLLLFGLWLAWATRLPANVPQA